TRARIRSRRALDALDDLNGGVVRRKTGGLHVNGLTVLQTAVRGNRHGHARGGRTTGAVGKGEADRDQEREQAGDLQRHADPAQGSSRHVVPPRQKGRDPAPLWRRVSTVGSIGYV